MEQPVQKQRVDEVSVAALEKKLSRLWKGNQHQSTLNALHATGMVNPEIKHQRSGLWMGEVCFNPKYYALEGENGEVEVSIRFRKIPTRALAQRNVEHCIAQAAIEQVATNEERNTHSNVG